MRFLDYTRNGGSKYRDDEGKFGSLFLGSFGLVFSGLSSRAKSRDHIRQERAMRFLDYTRNDGSKY
jgi:hypothetical protein